MIGLHPKRTERGNSHAKNNKNVKGIKDRIVTKQAEAAGKGERERERGRVREKL